MTLRPQKRQTLESFSYLWKVDDAEWYQNRKNDWKRLQSDIFYDCELRDIKQYQEYFLKGKLDGYINEDTLFFLTPIVTKEDSDGFFYSDVFLDEERERIITQPYTWRIEKTQQGHEMVTRYVRSFAEYRLAGGTSDVVLNDKIIFKPNDFVKQYIRGSLSIFKGMGSYSPAIDTLDFFMDSLPLLTDKCVVQMYDEPNILLFIVNEGCEIILRNELSHPSAKFQAQQLLNHKDEIIAIWEALDDTK